MQVSPASLSVQTFVQGEATGGAGGSGAGAASRAGAGVRAGGGGEDAGPGSGVRTGERVPPERGGATNGGMRA